MPPQPQSQTQEQPAEQFTVFEWNEAVKRHVGVDVPGGLTAVADGYVAADMARKLGFRGQAYTKTVRGKTYVIIKHRAGSRPALPGTRYLSTNPKVAHFVLGNRAAAKGAVKTIKILFVAYVALHIVEEIMSDQRSMARLLGRIGVDMAKVAISAGAGWLAGVAAGVLFAPAIAPVAVAFVVGVAVGYALDKIDERYGLTDKVVDLLERTGEEVRSWPERLQDRAEELAARAAAYVIEGAADYAERQLREAMNRLLRRYSPFGL